MPDTLDASIKKIVAKGKQQGFLTYEELNQDLPDEAASPEQIDSLLMILDELGIELIDELEAARRKPLNRNRKFWFLFSVVHGLRVR